MSSVVELAGGKLGFSHDGRPLGHEVVRQTQTGSRDSTKFAIARLQLALRDFATNAENQSAIQNVNLEYGNNPFIQVGKDVVTWLARAQTSAVEQFCQASVQSHAEQSERLRTVEPLLNNDALERAERLHAIDYLPSQAAGAYERFNTSLRRSL